MLLEVFFLRHYRLPGQAVLLSSTAQCVHLHALNVSSCLDRIRVWYQVRQTLERRRKEQSLFFPFNS